MHYRTPFWKLALGGVIAGAALYYFPFLVPALAFVLLAGLLLRVVFGFGHWHGRHAHMRYAYAMQWRNMSEDERKAMRDRFRAHRCGHAPFHNGTKADNNPNT